MKANLEFEHRGAVVPLTWSPFGIPGRTIMNARATPDRAANSAKRPTVRECAVCFGALAGLAFTAPAHAVDGCLVLLCFAAPNWRAIPACVPPIRQVLRDLARGKPFPTCVMAGAANSAHHTGPACRTTARRSTRMATPRAATPATTFRLIIDK